MSNDMEFLVECLSTELIIKLVEKYKWDIKKALDFYYNSQTFQMICNPKTGMYYESTVYVFTYLEDEIEKSKTTNDNTTTWT